MRRTTVASWVLSVLVSSAGCIGDGPPLLDDDGGGADGGPLLDGQGPGADGSEPSRDAAEGTDAESPDATIANDGSVIADANEEPGPGVDAGADAPADAPSDAPSDANLKPDTAGPSGSLSFNVVPTLGYSKQALSQVVVSVKDSTGNPVSGVSVSLSLSGGLGALEGSTSATSSSGLATFSGLDVTKSGLQYAFTASSTNYGTASSSPFEIDAWQPWNGNLAGGEVDVVAVNPLNASMAYAGTKNGVWRTADGGTTWARVAFPGVQIYALAAANDGFTVYAGNGQKGMYKSVNSGVTWVPANTGYTTNGVGAIAIHPSDPNTVYWATSGGILKSTNGGTSWTMIFAGADAGSSPYFSALAIAPSNASVVYAGVNGGSVYKSTNAGTSWVSMGAFGATASPAIKPILVDPTTADTVYVGLQNGQGVWKSTAGGAFTQLGSGVASCGTTSMAMAPNGASTYANCYESGVYVSTNSGSTWTVTGALPRGSNNYALAIAPSTPATLYLGFWPGDGGFAKTINGGTSWVDSSGGFTSYDVHGLLATKSGSLLVGGGYLGVGLMRSTDGGKTYAPSGGPNYIGDLTVAGSPFTDTTVFVGAERYALFTSPDTGTTFLTNTAVTGTNQVAQSPADSKTIYSVGFNGCFVTTTTGTTWSSGTNPTGNAYAYGTSVAAHPTAAGTAIASLGDGVYQTINSGSTWQKVNQGSIFEGWVAFDGAGNRYAAGYVVGTSVDGTTWTDATGAAPVSNTNPAQMLQAHTVAGVTMLYLGAGSRGLWRRIEGTWTQSGMEGLMVEALAIDPNTPTTQYAGTLGNGMFRTLSGGD